MFEANKLSRKKMITQFTSSNIIKTRSQRSPHSRTFTIIGSLLMVSLLLLLLLLLQPLGSIHCQLDTEETPTLTAGPPGAAPAAATATFAPVTIAPNVEHFEPTPSPSNASTASKLKPVNFTLVDEIFAASLNDDELVRRWKNMDAQFQEGIRSILKLVFPQIVAISQDAKVSGDCSGGILKWILSLRNLRSWAIKMLDATGKPTSGIFEGSLTMFGNYRQCLNIRAPDEDEIEITDQFEEYFRGQFCVIHLKPWMPAKKAYYHLNSTIEPLLRKNYKYYEKTLYDELAEIAIAFNFIDIRLDLCVPSTCTVADIQRVAELLSRKMEMRAKVMRCDTTPRDMGTMQHIDQTTALWLVLPIGLVAIVLLATILVTVVDNIGRSSSSSSSSSSNQTNQSQGLKRKYLNKIFNCLSIYGSLRCRLTQPGQQMDHDDEDEEQTSMFNSNTGNRGARNNPNDGQQNDEPVDERHTRLSSYLKKPLPLYGLRNLFIFWFILVQMTVELKYQYLRESLVLRNMLLNYWPYQIIINSTLLFESLILITAFTFSYSNLESSLRELVAYAVDKYLRLIPSIISMIALTIITPIISIESPVWKNFVEEQAATCKSTGYLDLFFLQNFISYEKICLPHTWLFCVEFQLIVLSIPLVVLLKKTFMNSEDSLIIRAQRDDKSNESNHGTSDSFNISFGQLIRSKAGLLGVGLILFGTIINFVLVYTNQLPPSWFYTFPDIDQKNYYFGKYLAKTWTHLTAFFVGLYAGHLCRSIIQLNNMRHFTKQSTAERADQHHRGSSTSSSSSSSTLTSSSTSMQNQHHHQQEQPQQQQHSNKALINSGILVGALVCMLAIIFSTYSWSTNEGPSTLVAALYDSLSRLLWSLSLVFIMVQVCLPNKHTNAYSKFARFLSHPICILMGRLSFLAYLASPYVHTFVLAVEEQSLFPSLFLIFHVIVGNIVITYLIAFILAIVIEQPIRQLMCNLIVCKTYSSGRMATIQTIQTSEGRLKCSPQEQQQTPSNSTSSTSLANTINMSQ